jgi:flagellar protein FliO/FliZ
MKQFLAKIFLSCIILFLCAGVLTAAPKKEKASPSPTPEPRQITDFTKKADEDKSAVSAQKSDSPDSDQAQKKEAGLYDAYDVPKADEPSMGWMFFKTVLILGIFGAGFYFFFKYVKKKTGMGSVGYGAAQVLSVVPIGQNKFLQIVDIGGRLLILGVTDSAITLIADIRERDEIDRLRLMSSKTQTAPHYGFQDFVSEHVGSLVDFIGRKRGGAKQKKSEKEFFHEEYVDEERLEYLKTQRERLRRMNGNKDDHEE